MALIFNHNSKCDFPEYLVLRNLAQNKISKFLRLMTEVEDSSIFTDDPKLFFSNVDHHLRPQDSVVPSRHYAHLKKFFSD